MLSGWIDYTCDIYKISPIKESQCYQVE
jgi:hypothetical protein